MSDEILFSLENVLNQIDELVWSLDARTFTILYANSAFAKNVYCNTDGLVAKSEVFLSKIDIGSISTFTNCLESAKKNSNGSACKLLIINQNGNKVELMVQVTFCAASPTLEENWVCNASIIETNLIGNLVDKPKSGDNLSILDNIRDAFFMLDNSGKFIFANKAFLKFIGLIGRVVNGGNIWEMFPEAKGSKFEEAFYRTIKEQASIEFEEFLPSINKWLFVNTYPSVTGMSVFIHDVSKRKKNNELLVESEKKFHLMSDNSPMFIWTLDENLNYNFYNKTFIEFSGVENEDLLGKGWQNLVAPEDAANVAEVWANGVGLHEEMNFECRIRRADGEYRWIKMNATPQTDINKVFKGFLVNGVDITDLKFYYEKIEEKNIELQSALNESRRLSSILNKTSNILVLTDVDGKITWVNEAFTKYKEYTLEEVIGKKPGPLVHGPDTNMDTINILHEGIQKKEITRVEILNYSKSGNKIWVDLRIEPIFKNGVPEGYMAIEMDITKRKKDELAIKERNEKIKEFSFITSHDLRHEFAKVMMLLNLAKTKENSVEDFKSLFNHLEGPVNKINAIISKINTNLYMGDTQHNLEDRLNEMDEIREICLVDDDELTNMIHKQIIKIILPQTPIRVYDNVDAALNYFRIQPNSNRLVLLDLVFLNGKSGWDFLDEYEKSELNAPIIILSSSIDNADLDKSKQYKSVLEYFVKPLTAETLHKYIKKKA